jgi:hypothetical protein
MKRIHKNKEIIIFDKLYKEINNKYEKSQKIKNKKVNKRKNNN